MVAIHLSNHRLITTCLITVRSQSEHCLPDHCPSDHCPSDHCLVTVSPITVGLPVLSVFTIQQSFSCLSDHHLSDHCWSGCPLSFLYPAAFFLSDHYLSDHCWSGCPLSFTIQQPFSCLITICLITVGLAVLCLSLASSLFPACLITICLITVGLAVLCLSLASSLICCLITISLITIHLCRHCQSVWSPSIFLPLVCVFHRLIAHSFSIWPFCLAATISSICPSSCMLFCQLGIRYTVCWIGHWVFVYISMFGRHSANQLLFRPYVHLPVLFCLSAICLSAGLTSTA